jgi:DNA-binding MarR family transcriptional regulator
MATAGGLSLPAAAVLARLLREGPCRLTDLATGEGVAQPSMTQLVTRLHRDGLVRRLDSASDGRVVLVDLTPAGRRLVQRRRAERAAAFDVLLDQLDPADRTAVQAALPALSRLADRALAPASRTATGVPA